MSGRLVAGKVCVDTQNVERRLARLERWWLDAVHRGCSEQAYRYAELQRRLWKQFYAERSMF